MRVVLVRTRNPLNIGAAARAMNNFGVRRLRTVTPFDPAFREARSAVGASDLLAAAEEYKSVADAVADCSLVVGTTAVRHRDLQHPLRPLDQAGGLIRKHLQSGAVALLFGSENVGLSNDELSHCHWLTQIPTHEAQISMNLGQAVAVCLYELVRSAPVESTMESGSRASAGDAERLSETLLDALQSSGYVKPDASASAEDKVRRLLRRLTFNSDDAQLLLGMLRQIVWKLGQNKK